MSQGTVWLKSPSDPRWNWTGEGSASMWHHPEIDAKVEDLTKQYGEPPVDLEFGGMKY
jgi:hypothetical protein